jgi:hypothetical protein
MARRIANPVALRPSATLALVIDSTASAAVRFWDFIAHSPGRGIEKRYGKTIRCLAVARASVG